MSALAGTDASKANADIAVAVIKKCRISISLKFMLCMLQVVYSLTWLHALYSLTVKYDI